MDNVYNTVSFSRIAEDKKTNISVHYDFFVDGKKLLFSTEDWESANAMDLNDSFEADDDGYPMLVLYHCICGDWECDSMVARVVETSDSVIWKIHRLAAEEIVAEYTFEKEQYERFYLELRADVFVECIFIYGPIPKLRKRMTGKLSRKEKKVLKKKSIT